LVLNRLGRIPPGNETFTFEKYEVTVVARKQNILTQLRVRLTEDMEQD
jgi:Mg2+/Co2+ transporter CorB